MSRHRARPPVSDLCPLLGLGITERCYNLVVHSIPCIHIRACYYVHWPRLVVVRTRHFDCVFDSESNCPVVRDGPLGGGGGRGYSCGLIEVIIIYAQRTIKVKIIKIQLEINNNNSLLLYIKKRIRMQFRLFISIAIRACVYLCKLLTNIICIQKICRVVYDTRQLVVVKKRRFC